MHSVTCTDAAITPRDGREATLIADHARDARERWDVRVGPLMRRRGDGKLIRLPDIAYGHTFDAPAACEAFLLGRGPGRAHGVIREWINIARTFDSLPPERQARLVRMALHNHQVFVRNLAANPPAPENAHKFAVACRPFDPWARIHRWIAPAPLHRCAVEGAFSTLAAD